MIARVLQAERTRQAARKARWGYAVASVVLMASLTVYGGWKLVQWAAS